MSINTKTEREQSKKIVDDLLNAAFGPLPDPAMRARMRSNSLDSSMTVEQNRIRDKIQTEMNSVKPKKRKKELLEEEKKEGKKRSLRHIIR